MRGHRRDRRGIISVLVAISLIAIVGVMALAFDGGYLLDNRQRVQSAADAAAMAAADDLYSQFQAGGDGTDSSGKAKASAKLTASANGFSNDGTNSVVTVNIPPTSGNFKGVAGYAEVIVQYNQPRGFSGIFGSSTLPVTARSVAGTKTGNIGILILDPHVTVAAQIAGKVQIKNNGIIYCNSDNTVLNDEFKGYGLVGGVYLESTANLSCGGISCVGKMTQESGSTLTYTDGGSMTTGVPYMADPLANVPEPTPSGTSTDLNVSGTATINPGTYGQIQIKDNATVTMNPGVYCVSKGFQVGKSTVTGSGVMIYNTSGDNIKMDNAVSVNLSPPTSGTYQGISLFEPRVETKEVHIQCTGNVTMSGTLYAQNGEFDLKPQSPGVLTVGNYICGTAEWCQGATTGTIVMNPATAASAQRPTLVE